MSKSLRKIAADIGIPVARRHIFLCADQTTPKCCDKARGLEAWDYLKRRLKELGIAEQAASFVQKPIVCESAKADRLLSCIQKALGIVPAIRQCSNGLFSST